MMKLSRMSVSCQVSSMIAGVLSHSRWDFDEEENDANVVIKNFQQYINIKNYTYEYTTTTQNVINPFP